MTTADSSFATEHLAVRRAVEDVIHCNVVAVQAEYAADLPNRVLNLITAYNTELETLRTRLGEQMQRRADAEEHLSAMALAMDARLGQCLWPGGCPAEVANSFQLAKGGIVSPSEVRGWGDGETDAEPSTA